MNLTTCCVIPQDLKDFAKENDIQLLTHNDPPGKSCLCMFVMVLLSLLTAIFPGEPGLAGLIEAKDDGSGGDNWSYKTCKSPVKSSSPTPSVLQAGCSEPTVSEH